MTVPVVFRGEGCEVQLEIIGYENASALDYSDANWLSCRATASCAGVNAASSLAITTRDLVRFAQELEAVLRSPGGAAILGTDENQIRLRVSLGKTGEGRFDGELTTPGRPRASMSFSCDTDQTYVRASLKEIAHAISEFPERLTDLRVSGTADAKSG